MAQYCRYCSYFVTGNWNYCEKKGTNPSDSYAKHSNRCKYFELNPMDAYFENENGYQPRKSKKNDGEQLRFV